MPSPPAHTKNQTPQGLDPNLYTRIDTIAPTLHANFGRGQLFPITANPLTMCMLATTPAFLNFHLLVLGFG